MLGLGLALTAIPTRGAWLFPSLDLQFAGAPALDSRVTFTRASKKWDFVNGTLTEFAVDAPALSENGLLIEESRVNQIQHSNDLTQTIWNKRNTVGVVLGASADGPDGTSDYSRVTNLTGLAGNDLYQQPVTYGASARYEPALMIRKQVSAGVLKIAAPTGAGDWTIDFATFPSGWQLVNRGTAGVTINAEFTSSVAGGGGLIFYRSSGAAPLAFDVAFCNTQLGTFPTSLIKTAGATVTRAADVATIDAPDGTYDIDIIRESGTTSLVSEAVSGGFAVPTDASPVERITFRVAA